MADYNYESLYYEDDNGDRIYSKRPPPPPQGPGQKVIELLRENEKLLARIEELEAVHSLQAIASELENGPIVQTEGQITRTLTNFSIQVRKYHFQVERVTSAYNRGTSEWKVTCGYGDHKFYATDPDIIDSECEAAADLFDTLQDLAKQAEEAKANFSFSRNKDKVRWDNLVW